MFFTIFTPTYNRADTLHRVYESLRAQTFKDFEWLIVDDGSTDHTKKLVEQWTEEADFSIRYYWQENRHKKAAFNQGVHLAKGEFFLPADSDDSFTPDALQIFFDEWSNIPQEQKGSFSGVCGLCQYPDGALVGNEFPGGWGFDSDPLEMRLKHKVAGEKWGFTKTSILRKFPFPDHLPGHVPESVVWIQVGTRYKTRFVNRVVRIYFQDALDQITRTGNPAEHASGHLYWLRITLEEAFPLFRHAPMHFFLVAARWTRFRLHVSGENERFLPRNFAGRVLLILAAPVGLIWWLYDYARVAWTNAALRNITPRRH